jgi:hypothetical protein
MSTAAGPEEETGKEGPAGDGAAELDEDVLEMVRRQLDRDPPPSTTALYGRAARINRDIYELSLRQFHAKYPLRVKRERARRERGGTSRSSGPASGDQGADAGPGDAGAPDVRADEDAGRRHLFGTDADPDPGGEDPRRSGTGGADGAEQGGSGAGPAADGDTRERVRRVLIRFAREVAAAERPESLVGVAERLPDRVDEIARIVRTRPPEA